MKAIFSWLLGRIALYALLVLAIGFALLAWPSLSDEFADLGSETVTRAQLAAQVEEELAEGQARLERSVDEARDLPADRLRERIAAREMRLEELRETQATDGESWLAPYLPSRILERKRREIEMALLTREIEVMKAALEPRLIAARSAAYLRENPRIPTVRALAASRQACERAGVAVEEYSERPGLERFFRDLVGNDREELEEAEVARCANYDDLVERRRAGATAVTQYRSAKAALDALAADRLPSSLAEDTGGVTLREILVQALLALLAITLLPFVLRTIFYHVLAPLAARAAPVRFDTGNGAVPPPTGTASRTSQSLLLAPGDVALVRQDYLQSSSLLGDKRTRWLLDSRHPVASLASGMRFLTRIEGAGESVGISATTDPFAEVAVLTIPEGASAVVRPRSLAALVHSAESPPRLESRWRLFSLPAWLTLQLRYFEFHGPVRLVHHGGRGLRIEPAHGGRILGQDQVVGFSTDLAYSVVRTETFWPYFFGRVNLLKDRVEDGAGVVLVEEAPLAGRKGLRRGIEGGVDAVLKAFGI